MGEPVDAFQVEVSEPAALQPPPAVDEHDEIDARRRNEKEERRRRRRAALWWCCCAPLSLLAIVLGVLLWLAYRPGETAAPRPSSIDGYELVWPPTSPRPVSVNGNATGSVLRLVHQVSSPLRRRGAAGTIAGLARQKHSCTLLAIARARAAAF